MKTQERAPRAFTSALAVHDELLLELHRKYPTSGGRNIAFPKVFENEPEAREKLQGANLKSLRSHVWRLIRRHRPARPTADGRGHGPNIGLGKCNNSAFSPHNALLLDLWKKYPTKFGNGVSFEQAFAADPGLRERLGAQGAQAFNSLASHTRALVRLHKDGRYLPPTGKRIAPTIPASRLAANVGRRPADDRVPMSALPEYCRNCGFHLKPVYEAMAVLEVARERGFNYADMMAALDALTIATNGREGGKGRSI